MSAGAFTLRPYSAADEDAAIELWRVTWQTAYPQIDFSERVEWWRGRWRAELAPVTIVVAEHESRLAGFVTVDSGSGYLDQLVVAPPLWGSGLAALLMGEARRIAPHGLDLLVNKDNARAIRFYEKQGFRHVGEDRNPVSGRPVNRMAWRP